VDPITGEIGKVANLPGWQGCRIVDEISNRIGVRTVMENDADAAALAEATWGSGLGVERFLYITLSTGIGGGFLLGGSVYRGAGGSHPEMGHHSIDPSGPECYCGAKGCWESLASGNALRDWFLENDRERRFSLETLDARTIFELYRSGDAVAEKTVERLSYFVGIGLANLTTILVPDVIAVGGGLTRGSTLFLDRAVQICRATCGEVPAERTLVRTAILEENLDLAGAAAVWFHSPKRRINI
jgi:glucokinase